MEWIASFLSMTRKEWIASFLAMTRKEWIASFLVITEGEDNMDLNIPMKYKKDLNIEDKI